MLPEMCRIITNFEGCAKGVSATVAFEGCEEAHYSPESQYWRGFHGCAQGCERRPRNLACVFRHAQVAHLGTGWVGIPLSGGRVKVLSSRAWKPSTRVPARCRDGPCAKNPRCVLFYS